jgi:hypothetical protein
MGPPGLSLRNGCKRQPEYNELAASNGPVVTHSEAGEDWPIAFLNNHFSILISQLWKGPFLFIGVILDRAEEIRMIPSIVEK